MQIMVQEGTEATEGSNGSAVQRYRHNSQAS